MIEVVLENNGELYGIYADGIKLKNIASVNYRYEQKSSAEELELPTNELVIEIIPDSFMIRKK